ncbi:MAG: TonB-dependent receptor [Chlorobaculum sp.]|nr:TonB-dependent receptor [Chlorobaculum sp.]
MKKTSFIALLALLSATAQAEENTTGSKPSEYIAPEITVSGKKGDLLRQLTNNQTRVLNPSQMSVYRTINLMPSINQQSVDPYGLADIVNYHEAFRFRGVEATAGGVPGSTVNVERLPVTGRPGGGVNIYDLENFGNINIYSGVMPANIGLGLTDVGGKIDMQIRRPEERFGVLVKESAGSNSFNRTYVRVDTGNLGGGVKSFVSASTGYADKWKGSGSSNRNNVMFGLTTPFSDKVKLETFVTYSKGSIHAYRPFTYTELGTLDIYKVDYGTDLTKNDYFGFNRNEFEDWMVMANLEIKTGENSKLNIKPYYWSDKGYYLETVSGLKIPGNNNFSGVKRWDIDHDLKGILAEYATKIGKADLDLGYLYHEQERPGPPTSQKLYKVSGGSLVFDSWYILSNPSSHVLHTAFAETRYKLDDWKVEGGLKYVNYTLPSILTYNTNGIGDVSYQDALAAATVNSTKSAPETKTFRRLFPDLTITRSIGNDASAHFSFGENYVTHVDIYPYYIAQSMLSSQAFYGKSFQPLWDERRMEISQNFELGAKLHGRNWSISPTVYYDLHHNKQAVLFDSVLNAYYPMNNADARAYGVELEAEARPSESLKCYGSFSWNQFHFTQDVRSDAPGNPPIGIKGEQVPDAPEFLAKGMISWKTGNLTISPIVRYTSVRYGDVLHQQKIDGATVFDLDLTWSKAMLGFRNVDCSLTFMNLFDKRYVSLISTSDYKTMNSTYYPGAPFTVVASVAVHY